MSGDEAVLSVVTSRLGMPAGLGELSVPHLPTGHLISPEPRREPLVQVDLLQPLSFSPVLRALGPWGWNCGCSVLRLSPHLHPHSLMLGQANEVPGPGSNPGCQQLHLRPLQVPALPLRVQGPGSAVDRSLLLLLRFLTAPIPSAFCEALVWPQVLALVWEDTLRAHGVSR